MVVSILCFCVVTSIAGCVLITSSLLHLANQTKLTMAFDSNTNTTERVGTGAFQRRLGLAAGLCFAADSMEVLLLSFLAVVVQAEWDLTNEQTSSITSSVFIGAMMGTLCLGPLGDKYGRKPVFVASAAIIAVFGLLTAAAHNLVTLIITRFMVGVGVGGLVVPFDTIAEFVPTVR